MRIQRRRGRLPLVLPVVFWHLWSLPVVQAAQTLPANDNDDHRTTVGLSSWTCPAVTVCPLICVPAGQTCPTTVRTAADAAVARTTPNSPPENHTTDSVANYYTTHLLRPPTCPCAGASRYQQTTNHAIVEAAAPPWQPCPAVQDTLDNCYAMYGMYYQAQSTAKCYNEDTSTTFTATTTMLCHGTTLLMVWLLWITVLSIALWQWQRWRTRQVVWIQQKTATHDDDDDDSNHHSSTQYGWRPTVYGRIVYHAAYTSRIGWILYLLLLSWHYYATSTTTAVPAWVHYASQEQTLRHFIVIWMWGFVWNLTLPSGAALAVWTCAPCPLAEATLVTFDNKNGDNDTTTSSQQPRVYTKSSFLQEHSSHMQCFRMLHTILEWTRQVPPTICPVRSLMGVTTTAATGGGDETSSNSLSSQHSSSSMMPSTRCITYQLQRYVYSSTSQTFVPASWYNDKQDLLNDDTLLPPNEKGAVTRGLSTTQVQERFMVVGSNTMDMPIPQFFQCLQEELSQRFYTYQWFMITSWCPIDYYYMAFIWFVVISTSALAVAWFHYRNQRNLYRLAHMDGTVQVLRNGLWTTLSPTELVPGDAVRLSTDMVVPCDLILIQGGTCLVDESALTGESYPQAKVAVDPTDVPSHTPVSTETLLHGSHVRHVLFAGTSLLQEQEDNLAIVWRTGSSTSKGELLRNVVSYERDTFDFDVEVGLVVIALFVYAVFCFHVVLVLLNDKALYGWFYGIYVVATVLPPLLPTVFTVSVGVSDDRLSRKRIATAQSEGILIAGKVTHAFFDKTGTLTKQGLDFLAARTLGNGREDTWKDSFLKEAMAVCHALTPSPDHELIGNPVDNAMFHASGARLAAVSSETGTEIQLPSGEALCIVRRFEFCHHQMLQSVLVQRGSPPRFYAIVKGSGESVAKACKPGSLPQNFSAQVADSARSGIYQISVAYKELSQGDNVFDLSRTDVESDLSFVGVLDFRNVMRPESPEVIRQLRNGAVTPAMITGDAVETGIRIALECGIILPDMDILVGDLTESGDNIVWQFENQRDIASSPDMLRLKQGEQQLALSGKAWSYLVSEDPGLAYLLAPHVSVFGRCTPHDKVIVIRTMVALGHITLMCGDGGNDTGALKAAHTGVALSDAEASMVAPFASLDKDLRSVVEVLKEGRCALASALATYKYMIQYGQVETINQIACAYFHITFSEWCWIFMDCIWTVTMAFTLPLAKPADVLPATRPTSSILGLHTLSSSLGVLLMNLSFTILALFLLSGQDWYSCRKWTSRDVSNANVIGDNYESEVLFLVTGYQYISSAMAYNFGFEWRQGWWKNTLFVVAAAVFSFFHFYATLVPGTISCLWRVNCDNDNVGKGIALLDSNPINNPFHTTVMPTSFRWTLFALMVSNAVAILGYEYVLNLFRQRSTTQDQAMTKEDYKALTSHDHGVL